MDPNANQPIGQPTPGPQPGQPVGPPAAQWPRLSSPIPAWQQGLGTPGLPRPPLTPPDPTAPQLPPVMADIPAPAVQSQPPTPPPAYVDTRTTMPASSGAPRKRRTGAVFACITLLAIAFLGVGYYALQGNKKVAETPKPRSSHGVAAAQTVDLATVKAMVFGLPNDLSMFKGDSGTDANYHIYLTQGSTDTKACSLEFGTATAEQLPGSDLAGIVNPQVDSLKKAGATVAGPAEDAALVVKDNVDANISYRLPTVKYEFSKDNQYVSVRYSLAVLQNGVRVVISRQCMATGGSTDPAALEKLEAAAKQITIAKR